MAQIALTMKFFIRVKTMIQIKRKMIDFAVDFVKTYNYLMIIS